MFYFCISMYIDVKCFNLFFYLQDLAASGITTSLKKRWVSVSSRKSALTTQTAWTIHPLFTDDAIHHQLSSHWSCSGLFSMRTTKITPRFGLTAARLCSYEIQLGCLELVLMMKVGSGHVPRPHPACISPHAILKVKCAKHSHNVGSWIVFIPTKSFPQMKVQKCKTLIAGLNALLLFDGILLSSSFVVTCKIILVQLTLQR